MQWILSAITAGDRQHINLCQRSGNQPADRSRRQGATKTHISRSSFQVSNLARCHCWSAEQQHAWRVQFCAYLLKIYIPLAISLEVTVLAGSCLSRDPTTTILKKLPDEPLSSQETGGREGVCVCVCGGGVKTDTERKRKLSLFLPNCPRVTLLIPPSATRYGASLQADSSVLPGETHEKAMKGFVWQGPARLDQLTGFFCALTRHTAVCNSSTVRDLQTRRS